ncbi:MAG: protein kinase [Anaerolineales bacterium]
MENPQPTMLGGRYQIIEPLGQGGMATVFHARDLNLQRDVALKILRDSVIDEPGFRDRFLQEARAAANLSHPNIVTVFDFGQDANKLYLVMEYIPGTDLKTLLRRQGRLPIRDAVDLMVKICSGVGYAHRAGLVHCDLKPHNILVNADHQAKITDFGISRALAAIDPDEHSAIVWGSPLYFAPEQAAGGPPSPASDVYSLGVILFEMLTGQLPFQADDASTLAELHLTRNPPSPRSINPDIPPSLEEILLKVLSKEPANRYRTADQFGRILGRFARPEADLPASETPALGPAEIPSRPNASTMAMDASPQMRVDWTAILLGLLAFLALGGLIPLWLWVCLLYPSCPLNP